MSSREKINDLFNTMGSSVLQDRNNRNTKASKKPEPGDLVVGGVISGIEQLGFDSPGIKVSKKGAGGIITGTSPGIQVTATCDESTRDYKVTRKLGR